MSNLIECLEKFNSKERFFLVGQILGNSKFTLGQEFRKELENILGISIPEDAFSAMDYHLDWLYASLKLAEKNAFENNILTTIHDNKEKIIKGQQEDIDWLIAFESSGIYHLILIEAKGVTSWSNNQMQSKAERLKKIFPDETTFSNVILYFVIISPSEPSEKLSTNELPKWMIPNGKFNWIELTTMPKKSALLCAQRCDEHGKKSEIGEHWKVVKRGSFQKQVGKAGFTA